MGQTPLLETLHAGGFLVSEANGHRSRERGLITGSAKLLAGAVLGSKITSPVGTPTANAANTGTGAFGAITAASYAKPGLYQLKFTKAVANAGDFEVTAPNGDLIGVGSVGVLFNAGGLSFTIADATDYVVGDGFSIVVTGTVKYAEYNPAATDGLQFPAAILFDTADATAADKHQTIIVRACEVNASELVWKSGLTSPQIATGVALLNTLGIICR